MNKGFSRYIKAFVFLGDLMVFNSLFVLLYLKGHFIILTWNSSWLGFLVVLNVAWIIIIFYSNPYKFSRVKHVWKMIGEITFTVFQHFLVTCTAIYLMDFELVHKWGPPSVYGAILFLMISWRLAFYYLLRNYRLKGYNFRNVIVVGHGQLSLQMERFFKANPDLGYKFLGVFDERPIKEGIVGIGEIESFSQAHAVDEIYCCLPYMKYGLAKRIIDFAEDHFIKVKIVTDFRSFSSKTVDLEQYGQIPVLNVSSIPLDDRRNQVLKRGFDIVFSFLIMLFFFTWLFPIIAILIKLDSKGPVFFSQKRTGKDNEDFLCWKFRTMRMNGDSEHRQASKDDTRITFIGSFLRKTSLDELPQFLNVLNGSMSVVGPRPHMLKHTAEYSKLIGKFMTRHSVKPGITGLAQSKGYRGETKNLVEMKNRVKLDRFYVENWSFILDVKIIVLTVLELIKGSEKAY